MHLQHPSVVTDAIDRTPEYSGFWGNTEKLGEVEACAANARLMQGPDLGVSDPIVNDGDSTVAVFRRALQYIKQIAMVCFVHGRLHNNATTDPRCVVHPDRVLERHAVR